MISIGNAQDRGFGVSVLIVDDDKIHRTATRIGLKSIFGKFEENKINVVESDSIKSALTQLAATPFHVVLLDQDLGTDADGKQIDGISCIPTILGIQPNVEVFVLTSHDDTRLAVGAMKMGACGYLLKRADPDYADYKNHQIELALIRSHEKIEALRKGAENVKLPDYTCDSPAMKITDIRLHNLAEVTTPVLFEGPTGVGKTVSAKRLSQLRARFLGQTDRVFFNINISDVSSETAATTLMGYEKGAFPGADLLKQGYLELANNGDLFLDEIGSASMELQQMLLTAVEKKEFQRVGGRTNLKTSARLIFATSRDLESMVGAGTFRPELYARISTSCIKIPSLEDRKEDIPGICRALIAKIAKEHPKRKPNYESLPDDLKEYLQRDNIPNNIRGIQNDLERLMIMSPRGPSGQPDLTQWKTTLGLSRKSVFYTSRPTEYLRFVHLKDLPTDFIRDDFPGLKAAKRLFEKRLVEEAARKFRTTKEIAKALKLSPSNAFGKVTRYVKSEGAGRAK